MSFPLVAPRPRRITTPPYRTQSSPVARMMSPPADALSRLKLHDPDAQAASFQPQEDVSPPPSSGRSSTSPLVNLPSDALEEFLSILRPVLFCPSSPTFLARRSEPAYAYAPHVERPQPFRTARESMQIKSPLAASISTTTDTDQDLSSAPRASTPVTEASSVSVESLPPFPAGFSTSNGLHMGLDSNGMGTGTGLWRSPSLSFPRWLRAESPVSRTHTRNPFHRHPSYDAASVTASSSGGGLPPSRSATQMSPALLPLPRSRSPSPAPVSLSPIQSDDSEERPQVSF